MDLKGRDFLTLKDFTPEEIAYLLDLSAELKEKKKKGIPVDTLRGKNVALIFEKTSTRTRCSFEVAAHDLGMGTTYLDPTGSQIGKKESIKDTARVLAGMYEGIEYRGFGQEIVEELAKYSKVPVWNGLTNEYHPTQMLADMLTIQEEFGHLKGIKFVYVIYTDVWVSMGEPDSVWEERIHDLTPYRVTKEAMANAKDTAVFLHCLPSFHDLKTKIGKEIHDRYGLNEMEVTDEVFESAQSRVFEEAENRMHTIKAVMAATLGA